MSLGTFVQLIIQGINMGLIYALAALAVSLIWNASGLFNFSQGDLLTLGGYFMLTFTVVALKLPYWVGFALAIVVMGTMGFFLSRSYFYPMINQKLNPQLISIGTVALSVVIRNAILNIWGPSAQRFDNPFGSKPILIGDAIIMPYQLVNIVIVIILVVLLQLFLRKTVMGIAMRAVAQKPVVSSLMGIKVEQLVSYTFLLSTCLASIAGVLTGPILPLIPEMGSLLSIKAFAAVLIGGLGSFSGALVGGLIVGISEVLFSTFITSTYKDVFIFLMMMIILQIRPGGIFRIEISEKV